MQRSWLAAAFVALCACSVAASAQGVGALVGYSFGAVPSASAPVLGTLKARDGIAIGLGVEGSAPLGFGINALYAQRGYTSSVTGYSQQLSYIDVPVYLKLSIPTPLISPFGFVGPQASFELDCSAGAGGSCPSGRAKVTYAGVAGIGAKFGILGGLSLQGRYVYNLTDLDYSTVSNAGSYKNRSFMLLVGFGF